IGTAVHFLRGHLTNDQRYSQKCIAKRYFLRTPPVRACVYPNRDLTMKSETSETALKERLDFIEMDEATRRTLRDLRPTLTGLLGGALDKFYDKMGRTSGVSHFFRDKAHMAGAKKAQQGHWGNLSNGNFDQTYVNGVTTVGKTHARIGLEPRW